MKSGIPVHVPSEDQVSGLTELVGTRFGIDVMSGMRFLSSKSTVLVGMNIGVPVHSLVGHVAGSTVEVGMR